MKEELLRILRKEGWAEEEIEDLKIILEGELSKALENTSPDIAETALKRLVFGRGSLRKRKKEASLMLKTSQEALDEIFHILKSKKAIRNPSEPEEEIPFKDLLEKCKKISPWNFDESFLEELNVASQLSKSFRLKLQEILHPYLFTASVKHAAKPVVIDGNNLLWEADLSLRIFDKLFLALSQTIPFLFPFWIVFDKNLPHILPRSETSKLKEIISSKRVFLHSPADELIISIAKKENAVIISDDKFKEYDVSDLEIIPFNEVFSHM